MSQIARLFRTHAAAYAGPGSGETEEDSVIARIATFEGGDAEEMRRINNQMLVERSAALPPGLLRVMVLMRDDSRWSVVSFFDDEEAARAAEARFEEMGDEIPEHVRGKRVSLDSYEVAFDVEMVQLGAASGHASRVTREHWRTTAPLPSAMEERDKPFSVIPTRWRRRQWSALLCR